jgi:hypothetical protein
MTDTSPEIAFMVQQRYAAMSPTERFMIGIQMFETARTIVLASLPAHLSEHERRRQLCERFYGALADQAYGSDKQAV